MRASVMAANGGQIPSFLDVEPDVNGVYAHHQLWQSLLYGIHIRGKAGLSFTMGDLYRTLGKAGIQLSRDPAKRSRAIRDWIDHLELHSHVTLTRDHANTWKITSIMVIDRAKVLAAQRILQDQAWEAAEERRVANVKRGLEDQQALDALAAKNKAKYWRPQPNRI